MNAPPLPPIRRATQAFADAIQACEREGIAPSAILAGATVALQRLSLQAATAHNPAAAARIAQGIQGIVDIVKAARGQ